MKIPTEVRLCWDFFRGCTCLKCTNRAIVHQPRKNCTIYFVGAAETAAPPGRHQPHKHCTNRANHKRLCWGAWVWQGCHTLL